MHAKFESLAALINRIQWGIDCQEYLKNNTERKKLDDLETLFRKAEEYKVPRTWGMFAAIETLYTQVKELVLKSKKFMINTDANAATSAATATLSTTDATAATSSEPSNTMEIEVPSAADATDATAATAATAAAASGTTAATATTSSSS